MAHYSKTYTSPAQLTALLQSRGLHVENVTRTENYLRHIGYYRFSAYLYPLLTTPKENHVFNSWMTIITVARNNCGHHARVWNRTFALQVLTQRRMTRPWITIPVNQRKVYFSLCIIKYFLNIISTNNDMKAKVDTLLAAYPSIDVTAMGFPRGWESEPLRQ